MAVIVSEISSPPSVRAVQDEAKDFINVFLKMWDGKTLCCVIDPSKAAIHNIAALEQRVLQEHPFESKNNFYFEANGKPLSAFTNEVAMWNNGVTVFVQYRNRGGCFMVSFTILMIILMACLGSVCTCGSSLLIIPVLLPFLFILPLFCL